MEAINDKIKEILKTRRLSYSSLKAFKKSPQHFVHYLMTRFEPTPAMVTGSAFDCMVLTPDSFEKEYAVIPKVDRRTKSGKEAYVLWLAKNEGKTHITQDQYNQAIAMKESLMSNDIGSRIVNFKGQVQKKLLWSDKETGFDFVGYADKDCKDYILDVKTCADASPEKFERDAHKLGYPLQAACYLLATHTLFKRPFIYVCVENKEPYGVAVYQATQDFIQYGLNEYNKLIKSLRYCIDNNGFNKSYDFHFELKAGESYGLLDIPGYAKRELE